MPIIRSFTNNFEVVDESQHFLLMPQTWTILNEAGLFQEEMLSTNTVTFEEWNGTLGLIKDQVRGARPFTQSDDLRKIHSYNLTNHPIVDALHPWDVEGKSAYGDLSREEIESAALARKMEKIRKQYDITKEVARFKTLSTGQAWAPNGTIFADFYADFGFTRNTVDFLFGTTTTDIIAKCEEVIANMQDTATEGVVITGVTAYCSAGFFGRLIAHPQVKEAFKYYQSTQEILRQRAGGQGLYRSFSFGGINFVEVRTVLAGEPLVPANTAIFVAEGTDAFVTYHGPALRFGFTNTIALPQYMWTFRDPRQTEITIECEMNMLNVLRRPNMVAGGISSN